MAMPISVDRDFYTVAEAARVLEVNPSTIWRWIEARQLPAVRVGPRSIRIRKLDLEAMVRPARSSEEETSDAAPTALPAPEELARRRALVARILEKRKARTIAPLTAADLVSEARRWETSAP